MPDKKNIVDQQELLRIHRRTLAHYLGQQAALGAAFVPPGVMHGIHDARSEIAHIKATLRGWGATVEDLPDDESDAATLATTQTTKRIFVSYKRNVEPDQTVAMQVFLTLSHDYEVFVDQTMLVGTNWAERIDAELSRSHVLIVFLSRDAVYSEMVLQEVATAHYLAKMQGRPLILPVRLDYREPFQYPLNTYLDHINWAFWGGAEDTPRLIAELTHAISGQPLPLTTLHDKMGLLEVGDPTAMRPPQPSAQPLRKQSGNTQPLELPEGTMDIESQFYIERPPWDDIAFDAIQKRGVTITIKAPRQMGKSSLLVRTVNTAVSEGKQVVFLDFQLFEASTLAHADTFYRNFCCWISDELEVEDRTEEYWQSPLSNPQRCTRYMGRHVLHHIDAPLVLAMDEVDRLFDTPFRTDFFSMLRGWHNNRALKPNWKQFDLLLVTSTEPYQLIDDLNQSPFNVGQVIELTDFTPGLVNTLNRRHGSPFTEAQEERLMGVIGGHPYLIRRALYLVASGQISVDDLFMNASESRGPFGDHLRYHLYRLNQRPQLVDAMRRIILYKTCPDQEIFFRLRGAGLVRHEGYAVLPRYRLYEEFFGRQFNV